MDGGNRNGSNLNSQTSPYYFGNCIKKMLKTNFDSLPDDVVFDILVRMPAQDIHNAVRLVCRKWYQMINSPKFIYSHLHHSTCGLLIQNKFDRKSPSFFVEMRQGRIEISKWSYGYTKLIWSSCNGFVLELRKEPLDRYVTNPATKRRFALPRFSFKLPIWLTTIAYAPTSMTYKVFCAFYDCNSNSRGFAMLTVGVDKAWRRRRLSETAMEHLGGIAFTTEGFVHWARKGTYVLTLNVETEVFTLIPPPECGGENIECYYLPAGKYLSLLIARTGFLWEVWKLKPETREWIKLPNIDLEAQRCRFETLFAKHGSVLKPFSSLDCRLVPVGWLIFQEALVFRVLKGLVCHKNSVLARLCIAYNVRTQEINSFELDSIVNKFLAHRNTLVRLDGC